MSMTVAGDGVAKMKATSCSIDIIIKCSDKTMSATQTKLAAIAQQVTKYLSSNKAVSEMETINVSVVPQYKLREVTKYGNTISQIDDNVITGYNGSYSLTFLVPIGASGEVMATVIDMGAQVDNLSMTLTTKEKAALQDQALVNACESANKKANLTMKTLNLVRGKITNLELSSRNYVYGYSGRGAVSAAAMMRTSNEKVARPMMPVEAGDVSVNAGVTMTVEFSETTIQASKQKNRLDS